MSEWNLSVVHSGADGKVIFGGDKAGLLGAGLSGTQVVEIQDGVGPFPCLIPFLDLKDPLVGMGFGTFQNTVTVA